MLGISLYSYPNSTSKTTLSSLLCLCLFFNKIKDKGRTGSAWKQWEERGDGEGGGGRGWEREAEGRDDSNNVCTCEQMNNNKKSRHSCFTPHFEWKAFSVLLVSLMIAMHFSNMTFSLLR
jgi:hypothetical protein